MCLCSDATKSRIIDGFKVVSEKCVCSRLSFCLAEWNSIKCSTHAVPFPRGFNLKCQSSLPVSHSPASAHEKFTHLFWLKSMYSTVTSRFFFLFFLFLTRCAAELHQSLPGETRIGAQEDRWGLSALCLMMKQAVCAVLSHAFNPVNTLWKPGCGIGFRFEMAEGSLSPSQCVHLNFPLWLWWDSLSAKLINIEEVMGAPQFVSRLINFKWCLYTHPYQAFVLCNALSCRVAGLSRLGFSATFFRTSLHYTTWCICFIISIPCRIPYACLCPGHCLGRSL